VGTDPKIKKKKEAGKEKPEEPLFRGTTHRAGDPKPASSSAVLVQFCYKLYVTFTSGPGNCP